MVVASAPGKVILFGEHAVVYGHSAVAAVLSDLRVYANCTLIDQTRIDISMPDLPSEIGVGNVKFSCEVSHVFERCVSEVAPQKPSQELTQSLNSCLQSCPDHDALLPVLFLVVCILRELLDSNKGVCIVVRSRNLPVGAGLGSSAAFGVALSASLMKLAVELKPRELKSDTLLGGRYRPSTCVKDEINQWAYAAECIMHGNPSGLDNYVSCNGGAVKLVKTDSKFEKITEFPALNIMLTNSMVPRSTREKVAGVRVLVERFPTIVTSILASMGEITEDFLASVEDVDRMETLVQMNHMLLGAIGVGHPSLDTIVAVTKKFGLFTKLTGAGGGGCAFTLLGNENCSKDSSAARIELERLGYRCYDTQVGGEGVLWHDKYIDEAPKVYHRWIAIGAFFSIAMSIIIKRW